MTPKIYDTDLSDAEWVILGPLPEPPTRRGRPRRHALRVVINAILYVLRGGVPWRLLPRDFPPWRTVYDQFRRWRRAGAWRRINAALRGRARRLAGRRPQPTAAIIDGQSVRTSEAGGARGYDGGKRVSGRKRHLVVDTQGLVLHARVHAAGVHDRRAAEIILAEAGEALPAVERLFADLGYQGLAPWLAARLGRELAIVRRPRRWAWVPADQPPPEYPAGFHVLPERWIVERPFAWLGRGRRLTKDRERLPSTTEARIYAAMRRLMARRLANAAT